MWFSICPRLDGPGPEESLDGRGPGPEVVALCYHFQFSGQGQRETPVANAKTLVQIILLLPGEQAAKVRTEVFWEQVSSGPLRALQESDGSSHFPSHFPSVRPSGARPAPGAQCAPCLL